MRANLPDKRFFEGKNVPSRPDIAIVKWIASGNDGLLFKARSTELRRDFACKIIPHSNLQHGPEGDETWRAEIYKANQLRNPAVVKIEDIRNWPKAPLGT